MSDGVIAIVRLRRMAPPRELLDSLIRGGITRIEITLPTPDSDRSIASWREASDGSGVRVGAGTVRTIEDANRAIRAGAQFLVTPTYSHEVLDVASAGGLGVFCGAATATECDRAWSHPAVVGVKVFPAESLGGPSYIRALKDPLDDVAFVPTGGVTLERTREYARIGCSGVGVGGSLVSEERVAADRWDEIAKISRAFVDAWMDGLNDSGRRG